jgi:hypothetical protein
MIKSLQKIGRIMHGYQNSFRGVMRIARCVFHAVRKPAACRALHAAAFHSFFG